MLQFLFPPKLSLAKSLVFLTLSKILPTVCATVSTPPETIVGTNAAGVSTALLIDRDPALYTGNFGDCMGGQSLINLTSFDAAYYADNMTVLFNMAGTTSLRNETLMLYISVEAYGENRFNMVFNPCNANFGSLCPLNSSIPIRGQALIPVSSSDVAGIPSIALNIPDFEGSAILRVFSNSSQAQIACFSAVMRNGASLSHPAAVGSILGVFTLVAIIASFSTAIYGLHIPSIRTHYAHSLSVLVIAETFHSIFFSGALSLNWPSVLTAWWSNFAWTSGMVHAPIIIKSLNNFAGISGNSSQAGGAGSTILNNNGGLQQQIYGRSLSETTTTLVKKSQEITHHLYRRNNENQTDAKLYEWAGVPVYPGLPLPGNWSGFPGELSMVGVPAADAFLNGFIWLLILLLVISVTLALLKYSIEALSAVKAISEDSLKLFRTYWLGFLGLALLRASLISFFMIMTLSLHQFSYGGNTGSIALSAIIFMVFFAGTLAICFHACFYRMRSCQYIHTSESVQLKKRALSKLLPPACPGKKPTSKENGNLQPVDPGSFKQLKSISEDNIENQNVHLDIEYIKLYGWLSARYRRTRWWFFVLWVVYQFVRACFVGGARGSPATQVIGLFVWEVAAFILIIIVNPFEGARNTALAVWTLGISKVATSGLSIAFLPHLKLTRIATTVIGIIIVIIQGFMVLELLILIILGAISSYISVTRDRKVFKPERLKDIRQKYFDHLAEKERDIPLPPPPQPEQPKEPYFSVNTVRRAPKIEDENLSLHSSLYHGNNSLTSLTRYDQINRPFSRTVSVAGSVQSHYSRYSTMPLGTRAHNASWGSRDFKEWHPNDASRVHTPAIIEGGNNTYNSSIPMALLVRPSASIGSLKLVSPSVEQQKQYASQRTNSISNR
ncbi:Bgt-4772 [Blumeria graminis f. sp. tritici]|uniref:Bgt-4772 n=2 Tax=Blumeria graminis f. sp. tritici TaxID=62690 RepID=A0A381LGA7_BLUGR|nr:FAD transporter [Blumeria graminis f. sp. tritici 96224]VDB95325.1 Bgt-4772 [Blumeria graminis f. sp. tritici]